MTRSKKRVETEREKAIANFCSEMNEMVEELYDLMLDGTDHQEKEHIDKMIFKLKELNIDRE